MFLIAYSELNYMRQSLTFLSYYWITASPLVWKRISIDNLEVDFRRLRSLWPKIWTTLTSKGGLVGAGG